MIERTVDHWFFEEIANSPTILPLVSEDGKPLNLCHVVRNQQNYCLRYGQDGGFIFVNTAPQTYEVHTLFKRGTRSAVDGARAAALFMFIRTDAMELVTRVNEGNIAAKRLTRVIGFRPEFTNPTGWRNAPQTVYSLPINEWLKTADTLKAGQDLHEQLEAAGVHQNHGDWGVHDRYAGAAYLMTLAGLPHKAAAIYNRWATMAGYLPMNLIEQFPVVNIGSANIRVGEKLEIVPCQ